MALLKGLMACLLGAWRIGEKTRLLDGVPLHISGPAHSFSTLNVSSYEPKLQDIARTVKLQKLM